MKLDLHRIGFMFIYRQSRRTCKFWGIMVALCIFGGIIQAREVLRLRSAPKSSISLEPCEVSGTQEGATEKVLCGTYQVYENRVLQEGRKINLNIVVFPATGLKKSADPFFYITGGPGGSATEDAPFIVQRYPQIRENRDMVFVDQRGTGGSNHLNCTYYDPSDLQSYLEYYFPLEEVRKCRDRLEKIADLKLYTTSIAMNDLDEVREALGYKKINILGASYGTRAAQVYLKSYSKNVRSVILHGVSPTNHLMPGPYPRDTQRSLNGVINECLENERCRTAFPNLRSEVNIVLEKLMRGPVETVVKHPKTGENTHVKLSRDLAGEAVRYMLYQPSSTTRIPLYLHLAAQGNFTPLAESALYYRREIVSTGGNGMYLSVTCAEDLPWIDIRQSELNGENTFLGNYRLKQQLEACALWQRAEIPKDYAAPTKSKVPALILTGQWDPVTPPVYGDTAAKYLPNSLHIIIPQGGHGFNGLERAECIQNLVSEFYNRGTIKGLDTTCIKDIRRKDFLLELPE